MTYCKQLHISHKKTCMTCMVPRKELKHWGKRDKVTRLTSDPALQCRPQQISIRVILMAILFILFAAFLFSMGGGKYLLCLCTNFWGRAGSAHKLSRLCVWTWSNGKKGRKAIVKAKQWTKIYRGSLVCHLGVSLYITQSHLIQC